MADNEDEVEDTEDEEEDTSELEEEFKKLCKKVQKKIDKKLAVARKALSEAEALAEEAGVPFYADISPLGQSYIPASYPPEKFEGIDREILNELAEAWSEYDVEGWQHSAVC